VVPGIPTDYPEVFIRGKGNLVDTGLPTLTLVAVGVEVALEFPAATALRVREVLAAKVCIFRNSPVPVVPRPVGFPGAVVVAGRIPTER
jgi:transketolase C-terminal domain/subunit